MLKKIIEDICSSTIPYGQKIDFLKRERSLGRDVLKKQDENGDNVITVLAMLGMVELLIRIYKDFALKTWKDNQLCENVVLKAWKDNQHNTFLHSVMKAKNARVTLAILDFFQKKDLSEELQKSTIAEKVEQEEIYLFLGGGNLSFELSFAQKHPKLAKKMVVTTYQEQTKALDPLVVESPFCQQKYQSYLEAIPREAHSLISTLINLEVTVILQVDARRLEEYPFFKGKQLNRVYFCHPHPEGHCNDTPRLIYDFFTSVSRLQIPGDSVIIARKKDNKYLEVKSKSGNKRGGSSYGFRQLHKKVASFQYCLRAKHVFNDKRYPGYLHVTTSAGASSPIRGKEDVSSEYCFIKLPDTNTYVSGPEDSESDTETSCLVAELERRNKLGETALHIAVKLGNLAVITRLLEMGIAIDATDCEGRTPLSYVIDLKNIETARLVAALLIFKGADPNFQSVNICTRTPLMLVKEKKPELIDIYTDLVKAEEIVKQARMHGYCLSSAMTADSSQQVDQSSKELQIHKKQDMALSIMCGYHNRVGRYSFFRPLSDEVTRKIIEYACSEQQSCEANDCCVVNKNM